MAARYPRGGKGVAGAVQKLSARDTVAWFESRGVKLKTEADGRMFPVSDSSETIVDCLMNAAKAAGVKLRLNCGVERVVKNADGGFEVTIESFISPPPAGSGVRWLIQMTSRCSASPRRREGK